MIVGRRVILVTPEREFDLGIVAPDERIVRELEGTKVVGVTVCDLASGHGSVQPEPSDQQIALGFGQDRDDPRS